MPRSRAFILILLFFLCASRMAGASSPVGRIDQPPSRVRRERTVPLSQVLQDLDSTPRSRDALAPGNDLVASFFPGSTCTLHITEQKIRTATRSTCTGTIDGIPGSYFILSRNEGETCGWFSFSSGANYLIRPGAGGLTRVLEVDPRVGWTCGNEKPATQLENATVQPIQAARVASVPGNTWTVLAATNSTQPARIDVLFVYTPSVLAAAGSAAALAGQIDMLVESANLCFSNSQVNAVVSLVHEAETVSPETGSVYTDLRTLVDPADGNFDEVPALRDQYRADIVCLLVTDHDIGGISELIYRASPGYAPFGYVVCNYEQSLTDYVFPHELGHDLGAKHDREADKSSPSPEFPDGYGYVFTANGASVRTVMAENGVTRGIPYFSNPDVLYLGVPTGVPDGQTNSANNAGVINRTAWIMESYRTASNSLAEAVDTSAVPWRTSVDHFWDFETSVTHDGIDAAGSPALAMGQTSWVEGRFFGPGTVDFWAKLNSSGSDALDTAVDGVLDRSLTPMPGWQHPSVTLTNGMHLVRWTYRKNSSFGAGDGAWLDQVNFQTPPIVISREFDQKPFITDADYLRWNHESLLRYRVVLEGTIPMTYQWTRNGAPLNGKTTPALYFPAVDPTNGGSYELRAANASASAVPFIFELQVPEAPAFAWLKTGAPTLNAQGRSLALDGNSNIFVCGSFLETIHLQATNLSAAGTNGLEDAFLAKYDGAGSLVWARRIGGNGPEAALSVRTDGNGNAYLSGIFQSNFTFGATSLVSAGGWDVFLAKFDPDGNLLWVRQAGGPGDDSAGVAVDPAGSVYLDGTFSGRAQFGALSVTSAGGADAFLAKYDGNGNALWAVSAGGTNDDFGGNATVDSSGNIYLVGTIAGTAQFQAVQVNSFGLTDSFVAKYTSAGQLIWVRHNGAAGSKDSAVTVAVDPQGRVMVGGQYEPPGFTSPFIAGFVDFWDSESAAYLGGLDLSSTQSMIVRSVRSDGAGNFYVGGRFKGWAYVGTSYLVGRGLADGFVAKFTSLGNALWIKTLGGVKYDSVDAMGVTQRGEIYLTGTYSGNARFGPLAATNPDGSDFWLGKLALVGSPSLRGSKNGTDLQLSWPVTAGDLSLESATDLSPTGTWSNVTYYLHPGNTNLVLVPRQQAKEFFRLR